MAKFTCVSTFSDVPKGLIFEKGKEYEQPDSVIAYLKNASPKSFDFSAKKKAPEKVVNTAVQKAKVTKAPKGQ